MRHVAAALFLAATVACGNETGPSAEPSFGGTFTLRSIDSRPLPIVAADSTLISSVLVLASEGTWRQTTLVKYPRSAANDTLTDAGTWAGQGQTFTFLSGGTRVFTGTGSASGFTLTSGSSTFVFTK